MEEQKIFDKIIVDDTSYETLLTKSFRRRKPYAKKDPKRLTAFIPGVIQHIYVRKGERVKWGQPVIILEAMKMQNDVPAPIDGIVKDIHVSRGSQVAKGELLMEFE